MGYFYMDIDFICTKTTTMKQKKNYYNGVNFITCKWAYCCKTWYGMRTPGESLVKSGLDLGDRGDVKLTITLGKNLRGEELE